MSFKIKSDKKTKKSSLRSGPSNSPPGLASISTAGPVSVVGGEQSAEGARAKLQELFGQIEHQFELMMSENSACKYCMDSV